MAKKIKEAKLETPYCYSSHYEWLQQLMGFIDLAISKGSGWLAFEFKPGKPDGLKIHRQGVEIVPDQEPERCTMSTINALDINSVMFGLACLSQFDHTPIEQATIAMQTGCFTRIVIYFKSEEKTTLLQSLRRMHKTLCPSA